MLFRGPALCFDCEEDMISAIGADPQQFKGVVVVIRSVHCSTPPHPECLCTTSPAPHTPHHEGALCL